MRLLRHAVQTRPLLGGVNRRVKEVENLETFAGSGDGESNVLSETGAFLELGRHVGHVVQTCGDDDDLREGVAGSGFGGQGVELFADDVDN